MRCDLQGVGWGMRDPSGWSGSVCGLSQTNTPLWPFSSLETRKECGPHCSTKKSSHVCRREGGLVLSGKCYTCCKQYMNCFVYLLGILDTFGITFPVSAKEVSTTLRRRKSAQNNIDNFGASYPCIVSSCWVWWQVGSPASECWDLILWIH